MATTKSLYDKYNAASISDIKSVTAEEDSKIDRGNADRLKLVEGVNKIRIWPKHPGEKLWMVLWAHRWITITNDKGEEVRRTIADGKIHGNLSKSLSDYYIEMAKEVLNTGKIQDTNKIKALTSYDKGGLHLTNVWLLYASLVTNGVKGPIEKWEVKKTVRDGIKDECVTEDADEPIEIDPFTDPKTGKLFQLTYNSKAKKSTDYYKQMKISDKTCPITLEELEVFDKMTPISQLSQLKYTTQDFEKEIEGVQIFDEKNDIGVFETEEFQQVIKDLKKELSKGAVNDEDDAETEDEDTKPVKKAAPAKATGKSKTNKKVEAEEELEETDDLPFTEDEDAVETEEEAEAEDQFAEMSREELVAFKFANNLDVKIFKGDTEEVVREKVRAAYVPDEAEEEAEVEEEEAEEPEVPAAKAKAKTQSVLKGKLSLTDIQNTLKNRGTNKATKK